VFGADVWLYPNWVSEKIEDKKRRKRAKREKHDARDLGLLAVDVPGVSMGSKLAFKSLPIQYVILRIANNTQNDVLTGGSTQFALAKPQRLGFPRRYDQDRALNVTG
jgi:hypothetical protein